jgi:ribosomal protein S18 acetylase RimI-like enzyme
VKFFGSFGIIRKYCKECDNLLRLSNIEIDEISRFISDRNPIPEHHIGYCGTEEEEIKDTLVNDFSDYPLALSFVGLYENNRLVGILGLDVDKDAKEAEIWGPFIDYVEWEKAAKLMWEKLIEQLPISLHRVYGFYHVKNDNGKLFMESLQGWRSGEHSVLTAIPQEEAPNEGESSVTISENIEAHLGAYEALHKEAFPEAYFSAEEMLNRRNDKQKLFVATSGDIFYGYVFSEANPSFGEGDIHFIAVSPNARNMGIGKALLKASLNFLFSFPEIQEITLCVSSDNQGALRLYQNTGFTEKTRLYSYEVHLED